MKRGTTYFLMMLLTLSLTGCGGGDDISGGTTQGTTDNGSGGNGSNGNDSGGSSSGDTQQTLSIDARPTDWVRVTDNIDPAVAQTMTVAQPYFSQYAVPSTGSDSQGDLMATFVNGTCRGVAAPQQDDSNMLFFLTVVGVTTDNTDGSKPVTVKYYSSRLRHIFTAQSPYPLGNTVEDPHGTRTQPLQLDFKP